MPAAIACVISYCTFGALRGLETAVCDPGLSPSTTPGNWDRTLLLVLFMVFLATIYTRTFYGCVRVFHRLPLRPHFRPAVGALLTGLVALRALLPRGTAQQQVLAVLSFGYSAIQGAVTHETTVSAWVLLAIALGKILTTGLTIGSGGSGGVFGPSMVIGGCGGGALGLFLHQLVARRWFPIRPAFVIVGMAGFFAAAAKTPFSTLIIVSEMTGGYNLLLPALWVCACRSFSPTKQSIYSSQVESRSRSPAHQGSYVREVLAGVRVSQFLKPRAARPSLHPDDPLDEVVRRLSDCALLDPAGGRRGEPAPGRRRPGGGPLGLASRPHARPHPGRRPDAERHPAAHARRHPRPGIGIVRGERPADPAGGRSTSTAGK